MQGDGYHTSDKILLLSVILITYDIHYSFFHLLGGLLGSITDPVDWHTGQPLLPNTPIGSHKQASDPTRMRVDGVQVTML